MSVIFSGTWNADLSKSHFLGAQPRSVAVRIEQLEQRLSSEILVTKLDGAEERVAFECATDGVEGKSLLNGKAIRGNARWEGCELVIESWMKTPTREMHFCDHWSLSSDGQTLTMEHRDDDLARQLTILSKVE